ncbi:hypothetical protein BH93_24060 [Rhodococcoides fascians A25f]|uniref:DUF6924 domain-containing protein n=1 Tax=Rhodococcoides fascians TaxID=1828 RepID=UPI0006899967|nr:hypothetical protein [Rhodococcus fascians]QII08049.1 hypothetical protein BH93_24060 [Rhodococcus fascians A25f]
MSMTWPQVRGLSYSTMGRSVRAEIYGPGDYSLRVWHTPKSLWRHEKLSGEVTFVENDSDQYRVADDGVMVHSEKSPHRMMSTMGGGPGRLLHAYARWPHVEAHSGRESVEAITAPRRVEVRGRVGWEVKIHDPSNGQEDTYVIDAVLGIALSWRRDSAWFELANPVLDEDFDPSIFVWSGPIREQADEAVPTGQAKREAELRELAGMPQPVITWLPMRITNQPQSGDVRTGALDLHVTGQFVQMLLRQWITELGEPQLDWSVQNMPAVYRADNGPWTYEIRGFTSMSPEDCERIIASIETPDPPSSSVDQIRQTLERDEDERRRSELDAVIGTDRTLDDYLDDQGGISLLIRTDFSDDIAWRELVASVTAPGSGDETDFYVNLTCIDNERYDGLTIDALLASIGESPIYYVFLADHQTITDPESPIVVVDTGPEESGHQPGQSFRVVLSEIASIENNLSIANMDFEDFSENTDDDGVFRGFGG